MNRSAALFQSALRPVVRPTRGQQITDAGEWRDDGAGEHIMTPEDAARVEIVVADYDAAWPARFACEREGIEHALGDRALVVEHVGSTSVPGLAAKPVIDILLVVVDSSDEAAYVPDLEATGYVLRIREPDWHEHRMLRTPAGDVHVHVFSAGSSEIERMLRFRNRLRWSDADRARYEETKRTLAARVWPSMQHYADAKTEVVEHILRRARPS